MEKKEQKSEVLDLIKIANDIDDEYTKLSFVVNADGSYSVLDKKLDDFITAKTLDELITIMKSYLSNMGYDSSIPTIKPMTKFKENKLIKEINSIMKSFNEPSELEQRITDLFFKDAWEYDCRKLSCRCFINPADRTPSYNKLKDMKHRKEEPTKQINYDAFKDVSICVQGCTVEQIKAFTDRIDKVVGNSWGSTECDSLELERLTHSNGLGIYSSTRKAHGSPIKCTAHLLYNPDKCEAIISQFEKDNAKEVLYTNGRGDKFYNNEIAYYGDTDDCTVCILSSANSRYRPRDEDDVTDLFKTADEAKIALINKLGEKVNEGDKKTVFASCSNIINYRDWDISKTGRMETREHIDLHFSDFAKLVENGVIS